LPPPGGRACRARPAAVAPGERICGLRPVAAVGDPPALDWHGRAAELVRANAPGESDPSRRGGESPGHWEEPRGGRVSHPHPPAPGGRVVRPGSPRLPGAPRLVDLPGERN